MKVKSKLFTNLGISRYLITYKVNERSYQWNESSSGIEWKLEMLISYQQLIEKLHEELCNSESTSSIQQYRNHLSTLNGFLTSVGKSTEERIGNEFKSNFDAALNNYLESVNVSHRAKSDRRSHLKKWRNLFAEISNSINDSQKPPLKKFNLALRHFMLQANISQSTLIKEANVSKSVLSHWLKGANPNARTLPAIHRVEQILGLNRGELTQVIGAEKVENQSAHAPKIEYRRLLSARVKSLYRLNESEMTNELRVEWSEYFDYKTAEYVELNRTKKGRWRLKAVNKTSRLSQYACKNGLAAATAQINFYQMLSFLGFLCLPSESGGYGLEKTVAQSLAWYAHPVAVSAFLEFITARSNGIKHYTQQNFATHVIAMTSKDAGYLWQQPEFLKKIPEKYLPKNLHDWHSLCAKTNEISHIWKQTSIDKSRNPADPIAPLLALEYPLQPIFRAIDKLDQKAAAAPAGGVMQARFKRDALLLAFLISNPLRILNFKIMTWSRDNSKHLFRVAEGQFRLKFDGSEMKTKKAYQVKIAKWLTPRLEEYLEEFREVLLDGKESDYLFFSTYRNATGKWESMERHIYKLTKALIKEVCGFGPHAFRHLVATDWLRRFPTDYLTVANLLNDKIETVIKNYSHLKLDDSFDRYESHIEKMFSEKTLY